MVVGSCHSRRNPTTFIIPSSEVVNKKTVIAEKPFNSGWTNNHLKGFMHLTCNKPINLIFEKSSSVNLKENKEPT